MKKKTYFFTALVFILLIAIFNCPQPIAESSKKKKSNPASIEKYSTQIKKLQPSVMENGANFGNAISTSGDNVIIGAFAEDCGGNNRGAVYIFNRNKGGLDNWGEEKRIIAADGADNDLFGSSVSIYGNYAVVGAPYKANGGTNRGSVYIYYKDQGGIDNWGLVKQINYTVSNSQFGKSVAFYNDVLVVGVPYENSSGTVNIYYKDLLFPDSWAFLKQLSNPIPSVNNDYFGFYVFLYNEFLAVSAIGRDEGGTDRGAVYVYYKNEGANDNWGQKMKITPSDPADNDKFGFGLCITDSSLIVGCSSKDGTKGAAYIFNKDQGGTDNWGQIKKLNDASDPLLVYFGYSVSICGDYSVTGAILKGQAGGGYVLNRNRGGTNNWGEIKKIKSLDQGNNDWFGISCEMNIDYAFFGASKMDEGGTDRGAVFIFK